MALRSGRLQAQRFKLRRDLRRIGKVHHGDPP
jgi:hypothetical protein